MTKQLPLPHLGAAAEGKAAGGPAISAGLPVGWIRIALSEIAEVRLGRQRSPEKASGEHMRPYMRAANVTWAGISVSDVKEMVFTPSEAEIYQLRDGDILLSEASGSAHEVGKPAIWRDQVPGACFQNTLIRVRPPTGLSRFLHLHFLANALNGTFARAARGVGIHHLGAQALTEWPVHLAPRQEQNRIVETVEDHLSRLDAAVEGLKRVQANLKRYRASVLKAAVEGRLVPTAAELARQEGRDYEPASVLLERILKERRRRWEEAELARLKASGKTPKDDKWKARYAEPTSAVAAGLQKLPDGWCWATIDQLAFQVQYGSSAKTSEDETGVPVLRMGNIADGALRLDDLKHLPISHPEFPELLLKEGDLLFNRTNSPELVGKSAVFQGVPERCSFASYLIRVRFAPGVQSEYTSAYLNSLAGRAWVASVRVQQVGQANVNGTKLKACCIPLPPSAEQERIALELNSAQVLIRRTLADLERNIARCRRLRQSVLSWAFQGRLVDQDPNDEPAFVLQERIRAERAAAEADKPTRRAAKGHAPAKSAKIPGKAPRRKKAKV